MKKKSIILSIIMFVLFLLILMGIMTTGKIFFDEPVMNYIYNFRSAGLTNVAKVIAIFGEAKVIIIVVVLFSAYLFLVKKDKNKAILNLANIVNVAILNQGIKYLVHRDRPVLSQLIEETGYSFPSGHSMIAVGFYGLLIYFISVSKLSKGIKVLLNTCLVILILLIGLSRIYLGVHYPSDICGGYLITLSYLLLFIPLYNKYIKKDA